MDQGRRDFLQFTVAAAFMGRQPSTAPAVRSVQTPVLTIGFEESGNPQGFPVVLLHGFPDDVRAWDGVVPLLVSGVFDVADDPRFERDGEDLYTEVLVTYPQLVLGATLDVPTVTSSVGLAIPPGTQSGQLFHLRGRGLARVNSSGTGDLHVRVQLWTPDKLSPEEEQLIERLAKVQQAVPVDRDKGFWAKMKEALGA